MPYKPTGRPPGRPPKRIDGEERVTIQFDVSRSGADYLDRRAAILGGHRQDVIRAALKEYAARHPLPTEPLTGRRGA